MGKGPNEKYPCSQIWKKDRTKNNPPCFVQPSLQPPAHGIRYPPACGPPNQLWEKDRTENIPVVKYRKRTELKITLPASCSLACGLQPMAYAILQHVGP